MQDLVYPRERTLAAITLVLGVLAWIALIVGTSDSRNSCSSSEYSPY